MASRVTRENPLAGGEAELVTWKVSDQTFSRQSTPIAGGGQITFGSDGLLYAIASDFDQDSANFIYIIDIASDSLSVIIDDIIIIEDPFSDISGGPGQ